LLRWHSNAKDMDQKEVIATATPELLVNQINEQIAIGRRVGY
jgi:phosphoserine phosphatase